MASRAARIAGRVGLVVLRALWVSTMVLTPLFGFWLASSLAAYHNASQWLSLLVGLLLFPIVPVGWDLFFAWRMRKQPERKRFLTRLDRLVLRTLLVNGVFLAVLLGAWPATAFRALAVRGDWIVDGHHGPVAEAIRGTLLGLADRLDDGNQGAGGYGTSDAAPDPDQVRRDTQPPIDRTSTGPYRDPSGWPVEAVIHPVVVAMPADVQASPETVGRYLAAQVPGERDRIKAVHDYVIQRLAYDHAAAERLDRGDRDHHPSQLAPDVFVARTAVCEGYARLSVAIGEAAGLEVSYITGPVRAPLSELRGMDVNDPWSGAASTLDGYHHAWNAVRIDGWWQLFDATWDDDGRGQTYETTYFLTPPHLFALDHLADEPTWQLLAEPMSHNEFLRQPALRARVGALGIALREPTRSQVTVDGSIDVVIDNPYAAELVVTVERPGDEATERRCSSIGTPSAARFRCDGLGDGEYELDIFGGPAGAREMAHVGSVWVNSR